MSHEKKEKRKSIRGERRGEQIAGGKKEGGERRKKKERERNHDFACDVSTGASQEKKKALFFLDHSFAEGKGKRGRDSPQPPQQDGGRKKGRKADREKKKKNWHIFPEEKKGKKRKKGKPRARVLKAVPIVK